MNVKLLGLFSGFPERRFTESIAKVLKEELPRRKNLVFISCIAERFRENDEDSDGMHNMFSEFSMSFENHFVIDQRCEKEKAKKMIREADCIFLMGGNATMQMAQINEKGLREEILNSHAVILGVSAGAMNLGKNTVDIYETIFPYEGIGFLDITLKAHYRYDDIGLMNDLKKVSMNLPVTLMTDESAIFVKDRKIWMTGEIYQMNQGKIKRMTNEQLEKMLP